MDTSVTTEPAVERRASTGISGLDSILGGGLPEHHIYLIEGDPGAGKTTLALQFLLEAHRRGEPVLYVTLSESIRELRAVAGSHGWSLDNIPITEIMPSPDSLLSGGQYTVFHPGDVELGTTLKEILEQVEKIRPTRVVFDSLSEFRLLARDSSRYRRQILGLKQFFASRNCTALLLDDCRRTGDGTDTTVLTIVHGVIRLERMSRDYGARRRRLEVVKLRGLHYHDGYHDYEIRTGGLAVYPRLAAMKHHAITPSGGSLSGVSELDQLLGGGLDRGTSTLLIGPAGSGKSSIASLYAAAAASRGENVAIYLFDEGLTSAYKRSRGLGFDLAPHVREGRMTVQQLDAAELSPGDFIHQIRTAVLERNLRVLVLDSLNGILNSMAGEHLLVMQLHELLSFLNQHGVVTLLVVAQYGLLGVRMDSPVDVSYLADTVILTRFFETAGKVRKAVSVVKKRTGGHENSVRELKVGPERISLSAPLTDFQGVLTGVPVYIGNNSQLMGDD